MKVDASRAAGTWHGLALLGPFVVASFFPSRERLGAGVLVLFLLFCSLEGKPLGWVSSSDHMGSSAVFGFDCGCVKVHGRRLGKGVSHL